MREIERIEEVLKKHFSNEIFGDFSNFRIVKYKKPVQLRAEHGNITSAYYGGLCVDPEYFVIIPRTNYSVIYHIFRSEILTKKLNPEIGDQIHIVFDELELIIDIYGRKPVIGIHASDPELYDDIDSQISVDGSLLDIDLVYLGDDLYFLERIRVID